MKILALDSATEACSAALLVDGEATERFEVIGRGHAERLLPLADELLKSAGLALRELDAIAFGRGPGGFTGLRIAAGIAQGLAAGSGLLLLPVSNLAALAVAGARMSGSSDVLACLDARMGQVYWAAFDCRDQEPRAVTPERLSRPGDVLAPPGRRWFGAGHGFAAHPALAADLAGADATLLPRAADIATIGAAMLAAGQAVPPRQGLPVYLRDDVVHRR